MAQALVVGSEAMRAGILTRGDLRWNYRRLYPDVYLRRTVTATLPRRIRGAWLWSGRRGVVAGQAAAAALGSRWVDDGVSVELLVASPRVPAGIIGRRERIAADDITVIDGIAVTTPARTAFDLARHLPAGEAVIRLDALARATGLRTRDVVAVAARYPRARGGARIATVLSLVDSGAESPKETWLRMVLRDGGLPSPRTQIRLTDGHQVFYLDMGWEGLRVAVEYDGQHHRTDDRQYVRDIRRSEILQRQGWAVVRVVAGDHPTDILRRVRAAIASTTG